MKKIVIVAGVLILAGLVGGTYYSSRKTEQVFTAQMERTRELYGSLLVVHMDAYEKGFLQSRAKTSVHMGDAFNLSLQHRITHLPWGARVVTTLDRAAYPAEDLAAIEQRLPLDEVRLVSRIGMTGGSRMQMQVPDIDIQEEGTQFRLSGIDFDAGVNGAMDAGDYDIGIASLQMVTPEAESVTLDDLRYTGTFRYLDGLPLGDGRLQLAKVQASDAGAVKFAMNNLACSVNTTLTDQTLNQYADLTFEELSVVGETCSKGHLKYEVTGLDADGMREIQAVYRSVSADLLADREPDPFLLQLQVMSKFWELLQKGVHVKLETLELQSAGGGVNVQGFVDLAKAAAQSGPAFDVNSLSAEATLQMDEGTLAYGYRLASLLNGQQVPEEEMARQADAFTRSLLARNILVKRDGGGFKAEFIFANGQGRLNGRPMPR